MAVGKIRPGKTRIVSAVDQKQYTISTYNSDPVRVAVKRDNIRVRDMTTLPSDIQAIVKAPFLTDLIMKLDSTVPVTVAEVDLLLTNPRIHPDTQLRNGKTALMYACLNAPPIIPSLIPGIDPKIRYNEGHTALIMATQSGTREAVITALAKIPGIDPNIQDNEGRTALIMATQGGAEEAVITALTKMPGLDPNIRDNEGRTALMYRYMAHGTLSGLARLEGLDPNVQDAEGRTVVMQKPHHINDPQSYRDHLTALLKEFPTIDLDMVDDDKYTALAHFADAEVHWKGAAGIRVLMTQKCDASLATDLDETPLSLLIQHANVEGIRLLFESNRDLGPMAVDQWVLHDKNMPSIPLMTLLREYINEHIKTNDQIGVYYGRHQTEQRYLDEIDAIDTRWTHIHPPSQNTTTIMDDDDKEEVSTLTPEETTVMSERIPALKETVLGIRRSLAQAHPGVPEINTPAEEIDGMRTILMYSIDNLFQTLFEQRESDVDRQINRVRLLLEVFPPIYTNVYLQDHDTRDLLRRLQKLSRQTQVLQTSDQRQGFERGTMMETINTFIAVSTHYHTPTMRDCTIAPMRGPVPCGRRYTVSDNEIRIWVAGASPQCLSRKDTFDRLEQIRTIMGPVYLATDDAFCTKLRTRDGLGGNEPIHMILPSWWNGENVPDEMTNDLFGVQPILEYPRVKRILYKLVLLR